MSNFDKQGEWMSKVIPILVLVIAGVFLFHGFFVKSSEIYPNFHPFHWEDGVGLVMFGIFVSFLTGKAFGWFGIDSDKWSIGSSFLVWAIGVAGLGITLIR